MGATYKGYAIPASFPKMSEWGLEEGGELTSLMTKGILLLDREEGVVVFGKAPSSAHSMKEAQIIIKLGVRAFTNVTIEDIGAGFSKKYAVVFKLEKPTNNGWERCVLWGEKHDVESFVQSARNLHRELSERYLAEELLESSVVSTCKSIGRVSLKELASKLHDRFQKYYNTEDTEETLTCIRRILELAITSDKLSGIINEEKMEYVDRDLIVKEQKVVNVDLRIDFNNLMQQLGNKGIVLTNIECPQCGGRCNLPEGGTLFQCQFCKASIKATDIFEKFKGILG